MTHWSNGEWVQKYRWNMETAKAANKLSHESGGGFQNQDHDEVVKHARQGGKKAHELGKAHTFSSEQARAAAKKSWESRRKASQGTVALEQVMGVFTRRRP